MPHLPIDGGSLYYEVHGEGPALVFAHGLGGNHLSWWQQVPHFRDRSTCVVFAHRGFWPSVDDRGAPDPARFAADLGRLLDHLGLTDVRLVAQSMGGWTCLEYALANPARVRALVMADTTGTFAPPSVARPATPALPPDVHPAAGARMAAEQPALHFLYRAINDLASEVDKEAVRARLGALRARPAADLAPLTLPVLCIAGEEDTVIPPDAVAAFAAALPNARFERVPRAGHSVYFERAAAFNRLVDDFLTAHVD